MSAVSSEWPVERISTTPEAGEINDRIELLDASILDRSQSLANQFADRARQLGIELGWHYLLDLSWIAHQLGDPNGLQVLDAGAGTGVLQWWMADHGARVISADRLERADLSMRYRLRYRIRGMRQQDLFDYRELARHRGQVLSGGLIRRLSGAAKALIGGTVASLTRKARGEVVLYNQQLSDMPDVPDESVDAIVSVSALEHNQPGDLAAIVTELERALKPGGRMLVTLAASRQSDWYHEPSAGWCYSESSLRSAFRLHSGHLSNFEQFEEIFASLRGSVQLREGLSRRYFKSGENGMPWGVWDPQYVPVGILKWKRQN